MKGSIHSDQSCPICGQRFKSVEPRGLFCPEHPSQSPRRFVVRYGQITKRFDNYPAALQFLTGLRYQDGSGQFDARDYQTRGRPLAFDKLAEEWLTVKAKSVKPESLKPLRLAVGRAILAWAGANIKSIQYAHVEDLINSLDNLAPKSRKHTLDALKQLWQWVVDRYDIPPMKKWPRLGYVEMAFRQTVDIETQEAILNDIHAHEPFRVWLAVKWLATYIAVRPREMCSLSEAQVDRVGGRLIIPHPKEKRAKIIPLIQEDIDLIRGLPLTFDQSTTFFRHETGEKWKGKGFGHDCLYRAWKRACGRLGVEGVSLYPGTKHSTACGLREVATPEEIKAMTLHSTSAAFHRYFMTGGNDHRELSSRRQKLLTPDNGLITEIGGSLK
jgi:integrase